MSIFPIHHHPINLRRSAALLISLLLLIACDKVPVNGDLDGMWQLTTISTPDSTADVSATRVYTSFQLNLVQWNDYSANLTYYSHFRHTGDSLFFYDFAHISHHAVDNNQDEWITADEMDAGLFDAWGIHHIDARYRILQLDSRTLRLQQADTTLTWRKF